MGRARKTHHRGRPRHPRPPPRTSTSTERLGSGRSRRQSLGSRRHQEIFACLQGPCEGNRPIRSCRSR
nr:MAG TPA: hypothetical protein [Caudoviricetes sp.]